MATVSDTFTIDLSETINYRRTLTRAEAINMLAGPYRQFHPNLDLTDEQARAELSAASDATFLALFDQAWDRGESFRETHLDGLLESPATVDGLVTRMSAGTPPRQEGTYSAAREAYRNLDACFHDGTASQVELDVAFEVLRDLFAPSHPRD